MFTPKDVEHYAELGRIRITAEEKKALAKDFGKIIEYVAKLEEVDTKDTSPMNGGVLFYNCFRNDSVDLERKIEKITDTAQTVRAFPEVQDGCLRVPPIFTD